MQHTSNMVSQQTDKQTKLPAIGNYIICLKSHLKTKLYIEIVVCKYTGKKDKYLPESKSMSGGRSGVL